jgi:hypothetical protein
MMSSGAFKNMDDAASSKLIAAMPSDVFARRAILLGESPPGIPKKGQ